MTRGTGHGCQAFGQDRANVALGADAALEEPGLVVESMRVGVAVRTIEAHRVALAFAGV